MLYADLSPELGDYISVDLAVFVNCESRQGYKNVVCFTDHATKYSWVYPMRTRDEYFEKLRYFIEETRKEDQALSCGWGCRVDKQSSTHPVEARRLTLYLESGRYTRVECHVRAEVQNTWRKMSQHVTSSGTACGFLVGRL